VLGQHLVKSWSSTQAEVALSSGEAEYYGAVKATGVGLGFQSLLRDFGIELPLRVWTDSTATIGICSRDGLGKLRHIDTKCLWLQHQVRRGKVEIRKVKGTENPADIFTKHLSNASTVEALLALFGCHYRDGRPAGAPALRPGDGKELGEALKIVEACYKNGLTNDALAVMDAQKGHDGINAEFMEQDGNVFIADHWEGIQVPEAWSYRQTQLPHMLHNMQELFPYAVAVDAAVTEDYAPDECQLERMGLESLAR